MAILMCIVSCALAYGGQPTRVSARPPTKLHNSEAPCAEWQCQFGGASGGEITVDPATGAFNVSFAVTSTFPTLIGAPPGVLYKGQWLTPGKGLVLAGEVNPLISFYGKYIYYRQIGF